MKKFALVAAVAATTLAATPAFADLTTSTPAGESLWTMGVDFSFTSIPGNIYSLNITDGVTTPVFDQSELTSSKWIVGADYDATTDSVLWIKEFDTSDQAIVRYSVADGTETVYSIPSDYNGGFDIRGIDVTDGIIRVSANTVDGGTISIITLNDSTHLATASGTFEIDDSNSEQSAVAVDPTTDSIYYLTYACDLYKVNSDHSSTLVINLADYSATIDGDCPTLDFDSTGRAWMTYNEVSNLASFDPDNIEATGELGVNWNPAADATEYGEVVFVKGPVASNELASTGFDASGAALVALTVVGAGATIVRRRRKA